MKTIKTWPTLYKYNTQKKVVQWKTWVSQNSKGCLIFVEHGQHHGKLQTTSVLVEQGKNIGRSNETTPLQQAIVEAESKWTKQQARKGSNSQLSVKRDNVLRPMLAKSFDKDGHHIEFPCYGQAKLDGIRCISMMGKGYNFASPKYGVKLMSRQNKEFTSIDHLKKALQPIFEVDSSLVLDGELYIHGQEFQKLTSFIKRDKASDNSYKIEYHLYDIINDQDYVQRYNTLRSLIKRFPHKQIKLVPTFIIQSKNTIEDHHSTWTKKGYEGIMFRNKLGSYKIDGRSKDLQKFKKFIDMEFEIVGAYENKGKQTGQCTFECITKDNTQFSVKPKGTDAQRRQYWKDYKSGKIKGKMLTVEFFSWTSGDNPVPRFPVGKAIREYE